jgi:hypothetical protein
MTPAEAIAYLEGRFGPREETGIESEEMESWIPSALERLTEYVAEGPHARDLQREDPLALDADGAAAVPADFLTGYISRVTHASSPFEFVILTDRAEFDFQACKVFGLAAVENAKIYTKAPDDGATLDGDIKVTGLFIPTLAALPVKFQPDFLDLLVEIGLERLKANPVGRDRK